MVLINQTTQIFQDCFGEKCIINLFGPGLMMANRKQVGEFLIDLSNKLGDGACGKVYMCTRQDKKYAAKVVQKIQDDVPEWFIEESVARQHSNSMKLVGRNIVFLYEYIETPNNHYLFFELCQSNLEEHLGNLPIQQEKAIPLVAQIVSAYGGFYKNNILHRDLKLTNILVKDGILKISDLGNSKNRNIEIQEQTRQMGTPGYIAPEVYIENYEYDYKADLWSIGAIFYTLLHGVTPPMNRQTPWLRNNLSPATKQFLTKCLEIDPRSRFNFEEMASHRIFDNFPIEIGYTLDILKEVLKSLKPQEDLKYILSQINTDFLSGPQFYKLLKQISVCKLDNSRFNLIYDYFKDSKGQIQTNKVRKIFLLSSSQRAMLNI